MNFCRSREDFTIPDWALDGTPGNRGFPDKPDIVIIKNWQVGQPPPTNAKRTPGYAGPVVTFVIVEHKMTNDWYLQDACNEKRSIYVQLVLALTQAGWAVELEEQVTDPNSWYGKHSVFAARAGPRTRLPDTAVDAVEHDSSDAETSSSDSDDDDDIDAAGTGTQRSQPEQSQHPQPPRHPSYAPIPLEEGELRLPIYTIIVGHTGCHLKSNASALRALGIAPGKLNDLLLAISLNAVQRTHHCLVTYKRLRHQNQSQHAARAAPPPTGVG